MRILIDTNVLLDVALRRQPFVEDSRLVIRWAQSHRGQSAVAWHSVSNFHHITKDHYRDFLSEFLRFAKVASGDTADIRLAHCVPARDFEDALQVVAALNFSANYVVTRNVKDFQGLAVPAITPTEFVEKVGTDVK